MLGGLKYGSLCVRSAFPARKAGRERVPNGRRRDAHQNRRWLTTGVRIGGRFRRAASSRPAFLARQEPFACSRGRRACLSLATLVAGPVPGGCLAPAVAARADTPELPVRKRPHPDTLQGCGPPSSWSVSPGPGVRATSCRASPSRRRRCGRRRSRGGRTCPSDTGRRSRRPCRRPT